MSFAFKSTKDGTLGAFFLDESGDPVDPTSADVTIWDAKNGTELLAKTALVKRRLGLWSYVWVHGFTIDMDCVAFFETNEGNGTEFFTIDTLEQGIDQREGQAF